MLKVIVMGIAAGIVIVCVGPGRLLWLLRSRIAAGIVIVYAFVNREKKMANKHDDIKTAPQNLSPEKMPEISGNALFAKKCELEQKMAGLVGGKTGMVMLLDMFQNGGTQKALYRDDFNSKQIKLSQYMKEYQTILEQANRLPKDEQDRFVSLKEIEQYQELLNTQI